MVQKMQYMNGGGDERRGGGVKWKSCIQRGERKYFKKAVSLHIPDEYT